jgi:hypothetical protein
MALFSSSSSGSVSNQGVQRFSHHWRCGAGTARSASAVRVMRCHAIIRTGEGKFKNEQSFATNRFAY